MAQASEIVPNQVSVSHRGRDIGVTHRLPHLRHVGSGQMIEAILEFAASVITLSAAIIAAKAARVNPGQRFVLGSFDLGEMFGFVGMMIAILCIPAVIGLFMLGGRLLLREFHEARYEPKQLSTSDSLTVALSAKRATDDSIRLEWARREPNLDAMLDAAELMRNDEKQEQALAEVAWLSAAKGNSYYIGKAVELIGDGNFRGKVLDSSWALLKKRSEPPAGLVESAAPKPDPLQPR